MILKCKHCNHIWDYKGGQTFYATCSPCQYKVNIKKNRLEEITVPEEKEGE